MRSKTFLLVNLTFLFLLSSISYAVPVPCDSCLLSSCQCTITDCSSGTLDVYSTSDCTLIPTYSFKFTGGAVTWSPSSTGSHYLKVLCDDGSISDCTRLNFVVGETCPPLCPTEERGGGGGGGGITGGGMTYVVTDEQVANGYTKELSVGDKFKFTLNEETHYLIVDNATSSTVEINITSKTQQTKLSIGEEKHFEITGDNYYDLSVKLNGINTVSLKANITIKKIYEEGTTVTTTAPALTTTISSCILTGKTCSSNSNCCSGYCCDNFCSDKECKETRAFSTFNILLIVGLVLMTIIIGYIFYIKFIIKKVPEEIEKPVY